MPFIPGYQPFPGEEKRERRLVNLLTAVRTIKDMEKQAEQEFYQELTYTTDARHQALQEVVAILENAIKEN